MGFKKSINIFRKKATRLVTSGLLDEQNISLDDQEKIKRILITRPNHRLGNQLLITPLIKEAHARFPDAKIDLFLKGNLGNVIFQNYDYVDRIISLPKKHFKQLGRYLYSWLRLKQKSYDLVINAEASSSSGRLSTKVARSQHKFFGFEKNLNLIKAPNANHISKYPVFSLRRYLKKPLLEEAIPNLELKLSETEFTQGKSILSAYADLSKPTICLYTFATGKKCFSNAWWEKMHKALQTAFPQYNIIEALPFENISALDFKIPAFYSQNIRELAAFISQTDVFITGDCGIMHLAVAAQAPTIGLFNVTKKENYQPYGKNSLGIDTNDYNEEDLHKIIQEHCAQIIDSKIS